MQTKYEENARAMERVSVVARDLKKWFPVRRGLSAILHPMRKSYIRAVDGISFNISKEEIFGIVGESGCGKTTVSRLVMGLIEPTDGEIYFEGQEISSIKDRFQKIQMIFQEPYEYLSPWSSVRQCLLEPLHVNKVFNDKKKELDLMNEIMEATKLTPVDDFLPKHSFELSGGQRQRVLIARAFMLNPRFVAADEPVSMLDASIRSSILDLILNLRAKYGTTFLFVTHDLAVARYMSDRIAVMYLGKIVETGSTDDVVSRPYHPYSKALIAAVPSLDPNEKSPPIPIRGEIEAKMILPTGCSFHPRCPYARDKCSKEEPELIEVSENRFVRCPYADQM